MRLVRSTYIGKKVCCVQCPSIMLKYNDILKLWNRLPVIGPVLAPSLIGCQEKNVVRAVFLVPPGSL